MKKFLATISGVITWFMLGSGAFAMCIWFAPPGRVFEPATNIKTLIVEDNNRQQFVVQPQQP